MVSTSVSALLPLVLQRLEELCFRYFACMPLWYGLATRRNEAREVVCPLPPDLKALDFQESISRPFNC